MGVGTWYPLMEIMTDSCVHYKWSIISLGQALPVVT